jgi:hypothetical protein
VVGLVFTERAPPPPPPPFFETGFLCVVLAVLELTL